MPLKKRFKELSVSMIYHTASGVPGRGRHRFVDFVFDIFVTFILDHSADGFSVENVAFVLDHFSTMW